MSELYPDALSAMVQDLWKAPHRRPFPRGKASEVPFSAAALSDIVRGAFFASLRAEEGHYTPHGVVIVPHLDALREIQPPWEILAFKNTIDLGSASLAKLAPAIGPERYAIIGATDTQRTVLGIGLPHDANWLLSEDQYPRLRILGPGDLVFFRGGRACFRYRAGEVIHLSNDFFATRGEPADLMTDISLRLFSHRQGKVDELDRSAVRRHLAELVHVLAATGHGGMLAILAPGDAEEQSLIEASDYRIEPLDVGNIIVDVYEGGLLMAQIDQETIGPPPAYESRPLTNDELRTEADFKSSEEQWRTAASAVAGAGSVDGAVLLNSDLHVLAFGCKLPRTLGEPPAVSTPEKEGRFVAYDLKKRGTRHAAAAQFAGVPGRLAITVSADGPAGCFVWSPTRQERVYWPINVGAFAPNYW